MGLFSLDLFHQHYKVSYRPRGLTSWVLYILCLLAVLVLPFIIGLAMQNFWVENNYFYQTPEIYFTNRCAMTVRTVKGRELLWTCNEGFNEEFLDGTEMGVLPFFSLYEDDRDANGKYSILTFTLSVPIGDVNASVYAKDGITAQELRGKRDAVQSVRFLPEFVYRIQHYLLKVNMTAAPLLKYTRTVAPTERFSSDLFSSSSSSSSEAAAMSASGGPLCALTEADLLFHSTDRLINSPYVHYTTRYIDSPFEEHMKQPADILNLENFARYYASRNQSLVPRVFAEVDGGLSLLVQPPSFTAVAGSSEVVAASTMNRGQWEDLDDLNSFTWKVYLRVPKAKIFYVPSYAETLKWAWVQYFVIAYLLQWFLWWVRGLIVTLGLIDTRATYSTRECR